MQVQANGLSLEVDIQGPADGAPLVLLMGLGMQLIGWPEPFVEMLTQRGYKVIRLDNRDAGLSQGFDERGMPSVAWAALRYALHLPVKSAYSVADMAADTIGVLDALGIDKARVCGASMGGMIAQHMAAAQPARISRLCLLMTSSGSRRLPQPSARVRAALIDQRTRGVPGIEGEVARLMRVFTLIGSPGPAYRADPQELRARVTASVQRAWHPAGVARQLIAVAADGDRSALLARISSPTHIVHGAADPLVPVAAAHDLHSRIKGSTIEIIEGMGHDLPAPLWPRLAEAMA